MGSDNRDKIVFLDMDGPVCNRRMHLATSAKASGKLREADPAAIGFLNNLYHVDPVHTRFVICSDWRFSHDRDYVEGFLNNAGFVGKFHNDWATPVLTAEEDAKGHGNDVMAWLNNHEDVTTWIAVDDSTVGYRNNPRLIKADGINGLMLQQMEQAFILLHGMDMNAGVRIAHQNRISDGLSANPRV